MSEASNGEEEREEHVQRPEPAVVEEQKAAAVDWRRVSEGKGHEGRPVSRWVSDHVESLGCERVWS